jgi:hypothetical protein
MTEPQQGSAWRGRARIAGIATVVLGVILAVGVGTAQAGERSRGSGRHHHPKPSASASASRTTTPSSSRSTKPSGTANPTRSANPSRSAGSGTATPPSGGKQITPVPANAGVDYQIGGPYTVPAGIGVVSRDHGVSPAAGKYNVCYVNGFQAQPDELSTWKSKHDDLLLKQNGSYVVDGDWNEVLLDTSTAAKRDGLVKVVGAWIDECASKGFQAVEVDNLDSWGRSKGLLTKDNAVAYATQLATYAHGKGLAIGQKNTVEIAKIGKSQVGFDFAVAESCMDYELKSGTPECQGFVDVYGTQVLVIEYDNSHFQAACTRYGGTLSIVQRDQDVTTPGSSAYVFKSC